MTSVERMVEYINLPQEPPRCVQGVLNGALLLLTAGHSSFDYVSLFVVSQPSQAVVAVIYEVRHAATCVMCQLSRETMCATCCKNVSKTLCIAWADVQFLS